MLYLREVNEGKKPETFLDDVDVTKSIDKKELWNHIQYEFGDMELLPTTVSMFKLATRGFFKHWNPIIDELKKTLEYEYDPLRDWYTNSDLNSERDIGRGYTRAFTQNEKVDRDTGRNETVNQNISGKEVLDKGVEETRSHNETENATSKETLVESTGEKRTYHETQDVEGRENVRVSAYNQEYAQETEKNWGQVPNYDGRDLTLTSNNKTTDGNENKDGTKNDTTDTTNTKTTKVSEENSENTDSTTTTTEDLNRSTGEIGTEDVSTDTTSNTTDSETTDDDYKSHKQSYGTTRHTYQSLIEEQRKVVQFDLCKWIMDKWSQEIMIAIW